MMGGVVITTEGEMAHDGGNCWLGPMSALGHQQRSTALGAGSTLTLRADVSCRSGTAAISQLRVIACIHPVRPGDHVDSPILVRRGLLQHFAQLSGPCTFVWTPSLE